MIWGVCGGLAKYFDIDPTIIRVIAILLLFAGGFGIVAYIILAIIVPFEGTKAAEPRDAARENVVEIGQTVVQVGKEIKSTLTAKPETDEEARALQTRRNMLGIVLIILGVIFLISSFNLFWWLEWVKLWPLIIVAIGIIVILTGRKR